MTSPAPARPRKSGVVVPNAPRWHQRLGAWFLVMALRGVALTLRYRFNDTTKFFDNPPPGPFIFCMWHNRLALSPSAYLRYGLKQRKTGGLAGLVSASRDGAFLAAVLEYFGLHAVRGSSSRRGAQALLELTTWAEKGYDLAITPDGPRGPCYTVQEGVVAVAQLTGLSIIPWSYQLSSKIRLKSWDRFQIPLPFALCEIKVGPPIRIPREASDAEREALRVKLEQTLRSLARD